MIYIRADGNKAIALGHVQRCLSIADALSTMDNKPVFITATPEAVPVIERRGYEAVLLDTDYRDMEAELPVLKGILDRKDLKDLVLVDSYQATSGYLYALGQLAVTAYIDDMGKQAFPVDILINYDIHADSYPYESMYADAGIEPPAGMLLGCGYAPLRSEFVRGNGADCLGPSVLVTTGGGDVCHILRDLPDWLTGIEACFHIIAGPFMDEADVEGLVELSKSDHRFIVHRNVTHMSTVMRGCNMAIASSGSTLYELCAMGIPAVIFTFAENQRDMARYFSNALGLTYAGDFEMDRESSYSRLREGLLELMGDPRKMTELSEKMQALVDGRGAMRIAERLVKYG